MYRIQSQVTLQEFNSGVKYLTGQKIFETHMGGYVKKHLRAAFPDTAEFLNRERQLAALDQKDNAQKKSLQQELADSEQAAVEAKRIFSLDPSDEGLRQKMQLAYRAKGATSKRVLAKIRLIEEGQSERRKNEPPAPWLAAVHEAFPSGSKMLQHVTADRTWDMYTIGKVLRYHLHEVFRDAIGCDQYDFQARDLQTLMRRASHLRTLRTHIYHNEAKQQPTEAEVLDALSTMIQILKLCDLQAGAAELTSVLSGAQDLCEQAISPAANKGPAPSVTVTITTEQLAQHALYNGLCKFDAELGSRMCPLEKLGPLESVIHILDSKKYETRAPI